MKNVKYLGLLMILLVILSACSPGKKRSERIGEKVEKVNFSLETKNNAPAVDGSPLRVAMVKDAPLVGIFEETLSTDGYDSEVNNTFMSNTIFDVDENFEVINTGLATMDVDANAKKVTIKIKDGVKWSDGQPLVAEDIIYPYEVVGSKDYTGVRYDTEAKKIVGIEDYHNGKAKTISGIKRINDKTVEISFTEMGFSVYTLGNGIIATALPKHYLKDVPIKDLVSSPKIRTNIVTLGPYVPTKMIQGESIQFKANPYYFKGKAKIEKVVLEVINQQSIIAALKTGRYDYVMFMPGDLYDSLKDLKNTEILGRQDLYYSYLGFKLGHFDKNKGINITDPKAKMGDKKLRQAMAYGLNIDQMVQTFYSGIRERATSMVPPVMTKYFPKGLKGYPYDPKKAKELLDEAGYKDINGDGYREDKNGKPFVIKMASMSGGDIAEPLAQFYIQNWKDIGLKVVLTTGRLIELNTFYDKLGADDKDIDVFFAARGVGSSLIPSSTAGKDAQFNYSRYVTEENERLMDDVVSPKTLTNPNYKAEAYKRWQEYYIDQAVVVPLTYKYVIYPVNKRLKNVYIGYDSAKLGKDINKWELTAKKPIR